MKRKTCVVVLIGAETADRPWVKHEIEEGWNDGKGVVGVYMSNHIEAHLSSWVEQAIAIRRRNHSRATLREASL